MSSISDTNSGTIGIKIANGAYYPILQDGQVSKKRLVLTTVKDNQSSVQIDLYRGSGDEIENAVYIGSLVIDDIEEASGGEPEIELVLDLDDEGNLIATAGDKQTGDTQSLSVSMESLDEQGIYDIPEFDLDESFAPEPVLTVEEESRLNREYGDSESEEPRRRKPWLMAAFILLGIAVIVLLAFLLPRLFQGPEVPPLQAQSDNGAVVSQAEEEPSEEETPAATETAQAEAEEMEEPAEPAPAEAQPEPEPDPEPEPIAEAPAVPAGDGVWYQLQWGDTLWDLASSFYRDPFSYNKIADENGIIDPDRIFAGREIYIPEPRR